jgi:hypothetical protein
MIIFFQDLFTKILVKSQGDMIQEINSTFKYGAMENMKDWQKERQDSSIILDKYNMVTANPNLVSDTLKSDPFRIGLSNDQPAGVRKVLYNLYSMLGLTKKSSDNTTTYMNENNISGYFGGINTLMLRGKYKYPNEINNSPKPTQNYAYAGGKRKKKTKRKKRKKKKTRRKKNNKKKTKRRRRKKKKTRRRR